MAEIIIGVTSWLFGLLTLALVLRAVLPWFGVLPYHPLMQFVTFVTEPILRPLRPLFGSRVLMTGIYTVDMLPLVGILFLWLIQALLVQVLNLILNPPLWLLHPGQDVGRWLAGVVGLLFQLYILVLLIRALAEWLYLPLRFAWARFIQRITDPLLRLIRRNLPVIVAGVDLSYFIALIILIVLRILITSLLLTFNLQL